MYRISHLIRVIDLRDPSNLFAVVASIVAGAIAAIWFASLGDPPLEVLREAVYAALAPGLAWALGRELDPDRPWAACLAAVLAGLVSTAPGHISPGLLATLLAAARMTVGSVGLEPTLFDAWLWAAIATALSWGDRANWIASLVLMAGLVIAARRSHRAALGWIGLAAVTGATLAVAPSLGLQSVAAGWRPPVPWEWIAIVAGLGGGMIACLRTGPMAAKADATGAPLEAAMVRAARVLTLAGSASIILLGGGADVLAILPCLAALFAVGLATLGPTRTPARHA